MSEKETDNQKYRSLDELSKDMSALPAFNAGRQWSKAIVQLLGFGDNVFAINTMTSTFKQACTDNAEIKGPALKFLEAISFLDILFEEINKLDDERKPIWLEGYNQLYIGFVNDAAQQITGRLHQAQLWVDKGQGSHYGSSEELSAVLNDEIQHLNDLGDHIENREPISSTFTL